MATAQADGVAPEDETEVLFNADCPVCNFEISHYADYARDTGLAIRFDDLNSNDLARWGLEEDAAARRLYVRQGDQLLSGIDGFLVLWAKMPRYRWLGRLVGLPGVRQLATAGYDYVLAPVIYRRHKRRLARGQGRRA